MCSQTSDPKVLDAAVRRRLLLLLQLPLLAARRHNAITRLPENASVNNEALFLNLCETRSGGKPAVTN